MKIKRHPRRRHRRRRNFVRIIERCVARGSQAAWKARTMTFVVHYAKRR